MEKKRTEEEKIKKVKTKEVEGGKVATFLTEEELAELNASIQNEDNSKGTFVTRIVAGVLTVVVLGTGVIFYFVNKKPKSKNNAPIASDVITEEKYSPELFDQRVKSFTVDLNKKGIKLTEQQVREFAAVLNLEQVVNEDPELAKELFGDKSAEDILTDSGHIIGTLMTNSFSNGYKTPTNLSTLVVGNDNDKRILSTLESYRDQLTTMRAEEKGEHRVELGSKEDEEKFNKIITEVLNFYSMNVNGLQIDGQNVVIQPMSDGTRFLMVLVMNEIALGNKNLLTDEQYKAFQELMSNEAVVANIQNIISGCQKTKTK